MCAVKLKDFMQTIRAELEAAQEEMNTRKQSALFELQQMELELKIAVTESKSKEGAYRDNLHGFDGHHVVPHHFIEPWQEPCDPFFAIHHLHDHRQVFGELKDFCRVNMAVRSEPECPCKTVAPANPCSFAAWTIAS